MSIGSCSAIKIISLVVVKVYGVVLVGNAACSTNLCLHLRRNLLNTKSSQQVVNQRAQAQQIVGAEVASPARCLSEQIRPRQIRP